MLKEAYKNAEEFAKSHYENFPVISYTLPKEARTHIAIVYQFARLADDIADEGNINSEVRIKKLELFEENLSNCLEGKYESIFWLALSNSICKCKLSSKYFFDLLSAFKQDVDTKRYNDYESLQDYCRRSANPVGRLVLEICGVRNEKAFRYSDSICTALQLTNFYQDVSLDWDKGRIYIPRSELEKFDISEKIFDEKQNNTNFKELMKFQIERTRDLFKEGRALIPMLPNSLLVQIKMTILGGERILEKIEEMDYDVLISRPKLSKIDYLKVFFKGLLTNAR